MSYMDWDGTIAVGNMLVDDDHRTLIACINEVFEAGPEDRATIEHVLDLLGSYTNEHFAREEELMGEHGFPDLAAHKKEHALLVRLYLEYREKFSRGEANRDDLLKFLKMWLVGHIKQSDLRFGAHLRSEAGKTPAAPTTGVVAAAPEKVPAPKIDWSTISVAIIDDATDLRGILRAMLRGFGTNATFEADNGQAFLEAPDIAKSHFHLLLVDDEMGPINGIELMYRIRTHPDLLCHKAVSILMAGDTSVATVRAALDAGFHGVVVKPFSANAIRLQAERFLGNPLPWEKDGNQIRPVHPKKAAAK